MPPPITSRLRGQIELERAGRIDDARVVGQARQAHRLGARRDDALREAHACATPSGPRLRDVRADELPGARITVDLALLRERRSSPPVSRVTTLFFQSRSRAASIVGCAERDAVRRHRVRFLDHLRRVQQRLRRNAADVEAHAAELRPALDQRDLEPEIGGAKRRGVAAGAGAEHDQIEVVACGCRGGLAGRRCGSFVARAVAASACPAALPARSIGAIGTVSMYGSPPNGLGFAQRLSSRGVVLARSCAAGARGGLGGRRAVSAGQPRDQAARVDAVALAYRDLRDRPRRRATARPSSPSRFRA